MTGLPALREELALHPGPTDKQGAPTWVLHDPVRNRFFRIPWTAVEILARWGHGSPPVIADEVTAQTTLTVSPEGVETVARFLVENQLTIPRTSDETHRLVERKAAQHSSWVKWLLHHYLFFRIPLVKPDCFLSATVGMMSWTFSRTFLGVTLAALATGLFLAGRQWDRFLTTLVDLFSWQGIGWYALAYIFVKSVHELGHAYAAKRFGCRVPTMGLAFLVLWPVLYTDTNEAWKLVGRRQRVGVAVAGVMAELMVAAWATLAWGVLPDGPVRMAAFLLATTTWISSLAINLSPFMRFDGYFLLMDALDMPNLHDRSFALTRWKIREWLFDLNEEAPERFSKILAAALVIFAIATWAYRLVLFLGIAVLVYHFFIKAVGVFLFAVEIVWFVLRPVWGELKEWRRRRKAIFSGRRWWLPIVLAGLVLVLAAVPWQGVIRVPAVVQARTYTVLYAPSSAVIDELKMREDLPVAKGDILLRLASPDQDYRLQRTEIRIRILQAEADVATLGREFSEKRTSVLEELQGAIAERTGLLRDMARHEVQAPTNGVVVDVVPDLRPGQWIDGGEPLFAVRSDGPPRLEAFIGEDDIHRVAVGSTGRFYADDLGREPLGVRIEGIERTGLRALDQPSVASLHGGGVTVRAVKGGLIPEQATYRIRLAAVKSASTPKMEMRGVVHLDAPPESMLARLWKAVAVIFLRESGM